jgi:hypothetical protein
MAKLKIIDNDDTVAKILPNIAGYVNVVNNLILNDANYNQYLQADEKERPELLQAAAGVDAQGRKCVVEHQTASGASEPIDNDNCMIKAERDVKKLKVRSKVTMPIPDTRPMSMDYLDVYASALHDLYEQDPDRARKFLFGIMLMTRCR